MKPIERDDIARVLRQVQHMHDEIVFGPTYHDPSLSGRQNGRRCALQEVLTLFWTELEISPSEAGDL